MWKSVKQNVVTRSSSEAEYRAMEKAFVKMLLVELGYKVNTPMKLWCGNTVAIHIANNPVFHERTKHIGVDCHYIRDKVKEGVIDLRHISTKTQVADIFTTALSRVRHDELWSKLCLDASYSWLAGGC